jgi:hypothetical protein
MALIDCKECAKKISDSADKCPHCGKKQNSGGFWKLLLAIAAIFFLVSILNQCMDSSRKEGAEKADKAYLDSLTPEQRLVELQTRKKLMALEARQDKEKEGQKKLDEKRALLAYQSMKAVKSSLNDPDSLRINSIGVNGIATIVCVDYRAKNAYGGYVMGTATFINGKASQSAEVWNANCTGTGKGFYDYSHIKAM